MQELDLNQQFQDYEPHGLTITLPCENKERLRTTTTEKHRTKVKSVQNKYSEVGLNH